MTAKHKFKRIHVKCPISSILLTVFIVKYQLERYFGSILITFQIKATIMLQKIGEKRSHA